MTNIIDINKQTLEQLQPSQEEEKMADETLTSDNVNFRFIKPSKYFYNSLMGLWLKFDHQRLSQLTFEEFLDHLKKHSLLFRGSENQNELDSQ